MVLPDAVSFIVSTGSIGPFSVWTCLLYSSGCWFGFVFFAREAKKTEEDKKRIPNGILRNSMVGDTRFELVTPAVSRQCSPPELTAHFSVVAGVHQRVDILSD